MASRRPRTHRREPFPGPVVSADAARNCGNNARGAEVSDGRLVVSSIYEWYKSDFGDSDEGVIRHLRKYAGPELAPELDGVKRLADNHYDLSLNAAKE
jgi:hypothetical protein